VKLPPQPGGGQPGRAPQRPGGTRRRALRLVSGARARSAAPDGPAVDHNVDDICHPEAACGGAVAVDRKRRQPAEIWLWEADLGR
jgi:hypothetical protein